MGQGLVSSKKDARRLITEGGAYVNKQPARDVNAVICEDAVTDGGILLRYGKKKYHRVAVEGNCL